MAWSLGGEGGRRVGDTAVGGQLHLGLPGRELVSRLLNHFWLTPKETLSCQASLSKVTPRQDGSQNAQQVWLLPGHLCGCPATPTVSLDVPPHPVTAPQSGGVRTAADPWPLCQAPQSSVAWSRGTRSILEVGGWPVSPHPGSAGPRLSPCLLVTVETGLTLWAAARRQGDGDGQGTATCFLSLGPSQEALANCEHVPASPHAGAIEPPRMASEQGSRSPWDR